MEPQAEKKIIIDDEVKEIINKEKNENESEEESEEQTIFPLARVKKIIQLTTNDGLRSDSVKLMGKATVRFIFRNCFFKNSLIKLINLLNQRIKKL